ncbi:MAG: agmatine deiminase family protein [Sulfurimonas sp.]|nr:agmatine deiminase family protein [Sulfurimonas sp.]
MKRLIAEFEEQSFTQIIFPPKESDWSEYLEEAEENFVNIINAIIKYQKCLVVCDDLFRVRSRFEMHENLYLVEQTTNDSWARDCSALCVENGEDIELLDFTFTGWGSKFEARKDNAMSHAIAKRYTKKLKTIDIILEGGGVESDGAGIILTTSECMLNPNRNAHLNKEQTNAILKDAFGASKILYLNHGYLAGDDTDSHVDTLARIISKDAIMYVKCEDKEDEHYEELRLMEKELEVISAEHGFKLIALPMSSAVYFEGERLPATYANFLFVNAAVLVPVYGVKEDEAALAIFKATFPERDIVAIDCSVLIRQHGSLHCVTMNFAKGVELI